MLAFFTAMPDWGKFTLILVAFFAIYVVYSTLNYNRVKKNIWAMQNALAPGDRVLTQSGLYGTLRTLTKNTAQLELAPGLVIWIDRFSIKSKADPAILQEQGQSKKGKA